MRYIYGRYGISIGFSLLLILLIANAIVTRYKLGVQTDEQSGAAHSEEVLLEVSQVQSLLGDAEMSQRGYIYTGEPNYLLSYDIAVAQIEPHIVRLAELAADSPQEQARIDSLRTLAQKKMAVLSKAILLYQSGYPNIAKEQVVSERGRLLMENIHKDMDDIARQETILQADRSARYQLSIRRTIASIYLATGVAVLGLLLLAYYIIQQNNLREQYSQQTLEREEWFRSTLASLGEAVIATDKRGQVTFLNSVAEQLLEIKLSQAQGQPIEAVFPIFCESTHLPIESHVKKVKGASHVGQLTNDMVLQRRDGHVIPIKNNAAPILDSRNALVGTVHVFQDATYQRQSQGHFRNNERIAASNKFTSAFSREIDVPLGMVTDLIYIVKLDAGVPPGAFDLLTRAENALGRVVHITREVLGFYRESSTTEQVDLSALVGSAIKIYSGKFHEKNITIERDLQACPSVNGLSEELKQAIFNVMSNAVDAVPLGGTIRAEVSCFDRADGRAVGISIQNSGPGIPPEDRDRIFEPFFTTKEHVGYGLGLWSTKGIVERHGGSIEVHFENGSSSPLTVFNIFLPVDRPLQPLELGPDTADGGFWREGAGVSAR